VKQSLLKYLPIIISPAGTIAKYKFEDIGLTSGKIFDYGGRNIVTPTGTTAKFPGRLFDGVFDKIDTGQSYQSTFQLPDFALNIWCKANDGQGAVQYLLSNLSAAQATGYYFYLNIGSDGKVNVNFATGSDTPLVESTASFANGVNNWKMVTVTVTAVGDGSLLSLYVNAVLVASRSQDPLDTLWTSTRNLFIGCLNVTGTQSQFFNGLLDDFSFMNTGKTAEQVKSYFEQTRWRYNV
jgi:hypothetical protein